MIKVIINGDDFGLSRGVNYGIIDAHQYGILNSATVMMNMGEVEHAFGLAVHHKNLSLGVHLVLTAGSPLLSEGVGTLITEKGAFKKVNDLKERFDLDPREVEKEWTAQIEKFLTYGRALSHLDSHHHVHMIPELQGVVRNLANMYDVPVRRIGEGIKGVAMNSDISLFDFYGEGVSTDFFSSLPGRVVDGQRVEIMCHPGYLDEFLYKNSSYTFPRMKEVEVLMEAKLPQSCLLSINDEINI
ncbi:chitin disaccharide deacetylase [Bacillus sp. 1P06AnD]|uniref:chitin disaccharide deacetylase n=1 Tax=Bacillus sp. 1P06AnD TaxID=3132208 RepID=UPI00399FB422